jgi:hypothetical protein
MLPRIEPETPQWEARAMPGLFNKLSKGIFKLKRMSDLVGIGPLEQNWELLDKDTHETTRISIVFATSYPVGIGGSFPGDKATRA